MHTAPGLSESRAPALVSRPSERQRAKSRDLGATRQNRWTVETSRRAAPGSTQVGFTRLASSNCRSRASPRSVSRYDRPGHERPAAREANRWPQSRLTMSNSAVFFVPATRSGVRVCLSSSHPPFASASAGEPAVIWRHQQSHLPRTRGGWSADRALFCFVARARRDLRALRRGLSRSERDLSRRSTMAIFGRGPTPPPPGVKDRSRQRLVRKPQGLAEGSLASRGSGSRRNRGTPLPAPPSGSSPETPLMSEDANPYHSFDM
jgi:hypothetical protein